MNREPVLLVDCVGSACLTLNESRGGRCTFRGKFQEANKTNKNKREYTFEALNRNVQMLEDSIKERGLFGELDHPTDSIVHLANTSHIITRLWWEGETLMGEGEVLPTPSGRALQAIIEAGGRVGISSRGVGNGTNRANGVLVIDESYKLITFDAVADPSTFDAYQKKVARKEVFEPRPTTHRADEFVVAKPSLNLEAISGLMGNLTEALVESHMRKIRSRK